MGTIMSESLTIQDKELDDLLDDEEDEEEDFEEELEEEEFKKDKKDKKDKKIKVPKSTKRRHAIQKQKIDENIYVTLTHAATYVLDGKVYRRNETVTEPRSKLPKFKNNGWFQLRY